MGRAVVSDRARPVDHENNGKILNADILHDLVVRTLQKGRINADYGFQTADSLPRGKSYGVFFRNADVEKSVGVCRRKVFKPRSVLHSGTYSR